jgi:hypothetical protein
MSIAKPFLTTWPRRLLVLVAAPVAVILLLMVLGLRINISKSIPLGLYWQSRLPPTIERGHIAVMHIEGASLALAKRVAAIAGDRVCWQGDVLLIRGINYGPVYDAWRGKARHNRLCWVSRSGQPPTPWACSPAVCRRHTTDTCDAHTRQLFACRDDSPAFFFNILQFPAGRAVLALIHSSSLDYNQLAHAIRARGWARRHG